MGFRRDVMDCGGPRNGERNVKIFFDSYGLNDNSFEKHTAQEIGDKYSMSRKAIDKVITLVWKRLTINSAPIYKEFGKDWLFKRMDAARANDLKLPLLSKYATPNANEGVSGSFEEMEDSLPVDDAVV
jgi:hypothetical protein